jgi:hypothetical protein
MNFSDMLDRISCFGEFDREIPTCLNQCGINFECAATKERIQTMEWLQEDFLPAENFSRTGN